MPAQAGIHLRFRWQAKENLDSGLRRNDERKSRLVAEVHSVPDEQPSRAELKR
jgi:hypothetical protein